MCARKLGAETLGCPHDGFGADGAARRHDAARRDLERRRAFENADAESFGDLRQAAHEPSRMNRSAMRGVGRAEDLRRSHELAGFGPAQEPQVGLSDAERPSLVDLLPCSMQLGRVAGEHDGAALSVVAVDALRRRHRSDLVNSVLELLAQGLLGRFAVDADELGGGGREHGGTPSAIPARCSEAGCFALQHGHPDGGVHLRQVVGGPQTGVTRTDDGDVDLEIRIEARALPGRLGERVEPVGKVPIGGSGAGRRSN